MFVVDGQRTGKGRGVVWVGFPSGFRGFLGGSGGSPSLFGGGGHGACGGVQIKKGRWWWDTHCCSNDVYLWCFGASGSRGCGGGGDVL